MIQKFRLNPNLLGCNSLIYLKYNSGFILQVTRIELQAHTSQLIK